MEELRRFRTRGRTKGGSEEYVSLLKSNFILLEEGRIDKLVWTKNAVNGEFTAKLGYKTWAWEKH